MHNYKHWIASISMGKTVIQMYSNYLSQTKNSILQYKLPSNKWGTGSSSIAVAQQNESVKSFNCHLYLRITQGLLCTALVAGMMDAIKYDSSVHVLVYRRHSLQKCFIKLYRTFSCDVLKSMWSTMWRFTEAHVIILLVLVYSSNKDLASMQHDVPASSYLQFVRYCNQLHVM